MKKKAKEQIKNPQTPMEYLKWFWHYIWYDDSWGSYVANFIVAFIFIKYLLFPGLGFVLNNDYPIVAIVSGSMEHKISNHQICGNTFDIKSDRLDLDEYWKYCGEYYEDNYGMTQEEFSNFEYKNGLNIGDVMVLYGKDPAKIEVGEVLVFVPGNRNFFNTKGPVIHRVVEKWQDENGKYHFQTKGDHNPKTIKVEEGVGEIDIPEEDIIGVGVVKIPWIGYAKLILTNLIGGVLG